VSVLIDPKRVVLEFFEAVWAEQPFPKDIGDLVGPSLGLVHRFVPGQDAILTQRQEARHGESQNRQEDEQALPEEPAAGWRSRVHRRVALVV
jgi:hypothetical protein